MAEMIYMSYVLRFFIFFSTWFILFLYFKLKIPF